MDGANGLILGMSVGMLVQFIVLGIGVGAFGTLIGAGGGLVFVPVFCIPLQTGRRLWSWELRSLLLCLMPCLHRQRLLSKRKSSIVQPFGLPWLRFRARI